MTKTWIALAASLLLVACSSQASDATRTEPSERPVVQRPPAPANPDIPAMPAKTDPVLVEVNGRKLTESVALMEAQRTMAAMNRQKSIPSNNVEQVRQRALAGVIDMFVARALLNEEADRLGIQSTPQEEQNALDQMRKNIAPGKTLTQMLEENSLTERQVRQELAERIRIQKLLSNAVPATASVSAEEVDTYVAKHGKELNMAESVHARHILLATGTNNTDAAKAERRKAAEAIREELVKGADFAEVARERSDCPSRTKGGDLGTFTRGRMVPPFEEAAFRQEVGAIGDIVETAFGYHIIQVIEHKPAERVPRERIVALLERQKKAAAMEEWINGLKAKAEIKYSPNAPRMPERPTMPGR